MAHPHDLRAAHTRHKTLVRLQRFFCDEIDAPAATGVRPPRVRLLVKFFERDHLCEARAKLLPVDSPQPIVLSPRLGYAEGTGGFREQADVYAILRGSRGEFIWMRSEKAAMTSGASCPSPYLVDNNNIATRTSTRAPAPPSTLLLASCLSEYAHTLDSLPTAKIYEEATRVKHGGEDTIRIVCHVADRPRYRRAHMRTLLDPMPDKKFSKTAEQLGRRSLYLHVTSKQYYPPGVTGEGRRRNRRQAGANTSCGRLLLNGTYPNLEKKKPAQRDDDAYVTRNPRKKERLEGAPAPR
ncbi:hypothetical protein DICSQDRAFT_171230 [Dichomitus squalens LYAD-421 SS1]|uniref:Uncharacterized protein n=1 Tax=Dichomitus squalens (strain LYAD-421) TaxID=732165 RepID=R7SX18_DICSQ|nr:uncharacterized protein DICSQDRAFT_171230 [Dichomitus squalens LYAD-421 SS1]EJF60260.1 hypothetical protein DICSQDRAFT_171230 [Dichomitus squalens LYAD-421 SS1]